MSVRFRQVTPNALTVLRFVLACAFPFLDETWWVPVILIAGCTEFLDGYLARHWNVITDFGRQLDPVADKVFVGMVLFTFFNQEILTGYEILFILARDAMVVFGGFLAWALGLGRKFLAVSPKYSGKVATGFQFLFLFVTCFYRHANETLLYVTAAVSVIAALDYLTLGIYHVIQKYRA